MHLSIIEQSKTDKFHNAYEDARIKSEKAYGKPMAAESCRNSATLIIQDLENAIAVQKSIYIFWQKTCDTLIEVRKLVEQMGYALSSDMKIQKEINIRGE
jgi:hypothetical protein